MFLFFARPLFAAAVVLCATAAMPALAELLVSAEWLKQHQSYPSVVTVDVRSAIDGGGDEAYARALIPGTIHSD
jgi:3-mercaptopyruvate sulfurtransferase SseA